MRLPSTRQQQARCCSSMIVARHAHGLRQALVLNRRLQHHAFVELRHHLALDLLPWRLALGKGKPPFWARVARRSFSSASEIKMLAVPFLRSMRTWSPVLISANPPPAAASGEALRIEGEPEVPDCRPSPTQGSACTPFLSSAAGGCMLTTSAPPG